MPEAPDPPAETWSALTLRDRSGMYLARGITWRAARTPSPFRAETWADAAELELWLADRNPLFRSMIARGGWGTARLTCRVRALPFRVQADPIRALPRPHRSRRP